MVDESDHGAETGDGNGGGHRTGDADGDGHRADNEDSEAGDDVWTRVFGVVVAGVVAVVGLATLTSAGIGSPVSRVAFSLLLGVVAGQAAEEL